MIGLKIDRAIVRLSKKLKDVILTKPNHVLPLFGAYTPLWSSFVIVFESVLTDISVHNSIENKKYLYASNFNKTTML